jgi:SAM-dependent methyltransferase
VPQSHWNDANYHKRWARIGPPLRPDADVVAAFRQAIASHDENLLLLGVTQELAGLGQTLTAVDKNEQMIANVWPGDSAGRKALEGNWLSLPFADDAFTAAIGDGSANWPTYPGDLRSFFAEMARVIRPGGILALRVFLTPEYPEAIGEVREHTMRRGIESFHAFKWRLAMAVVSRAGDPNIPVAIIRDNFDRLFFDRRALSEATGWPMEVIETIDAYKGSPDIYSFPTLSQMKAVIPENFRNLRIVDSGHYELADRCPLLVMERV